MASQLFKHASNYSIGSALLVVAGLVSFPLLTRVLSVDEYGLMSLVATALGLLVAVAKLGMQHATLRFYSEIRAGKRDVGNDAFVSTAIYGMTGVGLAAALSWALISQVVPAAWWNDDRIKSLMLLASVLILVRVFDSALINQLRAQERSGALMTYAVCRRYVTLALMLVVLFYVAGNVWGFYVSVLVGELLAAVFMAWWMFRRDPPRLAAFSTPLLRAMLAYGIPMIGYELSSVVLTMGNRYIIQSQLGSEPLGVFSAAYNMCEYIKMTLFGSLVVAAQPMYMRYWEEKGVEATSAFLAGFMRIYMMVSMLVVGGLAAIGGELLGFLASEKYVSGGPLIPYIMAGMAVEAVLIITGAGLYIQKRTKTIMVLVFGTAILNLVLNMWLISMFGLVGAAASTMIAYLLLMVAGATLGRRALPFPMPFGPALKFGAIAAVMYFSVVQIDLHNHLLTMVVRMAAGFAIYGVLAVALDQAARHKAVEWRDKLLRR